MNSAFLIIDASVKYDFDVLTKHRVPAAIPLFGKYRFIDIPLSNAMNSFITNVGIFLYGNFKSLTDHVGSGDRYNLNRRRDGVFLLGDKNYNINSENFVSFQRMSQHREFFRRTHQDYAVITPATLIWGVDYKELVEEHIRSGKDITQVVDKDNNKLMTFIISKEKLVNYIDHYEESTYYSLLDVFEYSPLESKNTIVYKNYAKLIKNINEYYQISMDLVKKNSGFNLKEVFSKLNTKDPLNDAAYYGMDASIKNVVSASGVEVYGTIESSVLSRRVKIGKGSVIKNSVILNNAVIGDNCYIENAILDKETKVVDGAIINGTIDRPFVSEKRQVVSTSQMPKIAMLTAECSPFIKNGGLADMVGSLSTELVDEGAEVMVFVPLYRKIKKKFYTSLIFDRQLDATIDSKEYKISVYKIFKEKLTYIFIDLYTHFDRDNVYGYEDDPYRFGYFTELVLKYMELVNYKPDIIHSHDWHMALLALFKKKYEYFKESKTVLTIHNLNYQGITTKKVLDDFNLDYYLYGSTLNILEAGINSFDFITTVSKTYAEELKYDYYSGNLRDNIIYRYSHLYGIVNGLDSKFDPSTDIEIMAKYSQKDVHEKKEINKKFLCDICGFEYSKDAFIMGSVSRINEMKGFDLIIDSLDELLKDKNTYFVLLGTGDNDLMLRLKDMEIKYPKQVKLFLTYDGTNPSYIYSGADIFLMPSRIEPCGTSQMIALKYGTIPIVRQTGGLNDTITIYDKDSRIGNGFKFYNYDSRELLFSIDLAKYLFYNDKEAWMNLIDNAMACDYSFKKCAKEYINLYNMIRNSGE